MESDPLVDQPIRPFRRLLWKLILSYTAVTVGSLLVIVLVLGYLLFSRVLVPIDILESTLSPKFWIEAVSQNAPPEWEYILNQDPIDTKLVSMLLKDGDFQITHFDLFQIGDLQIQMRTAGEGSVIFVDENGILLGASNQRFVTPEQIGTPLDPQTLPGLAVPMETALSGKMDPEKLFVTLNPNEQFYFALPYFDDKNERVLGVGILYFESLPTGNDIPANLITLLNRSVLILLLAAGLIGTIFGAWTARGMVKRLQRVSQATDAWSQGDFSEFIEDPVGDEISQLATRLNNMAIQLQNYVKRNQQMAISEERNRLARDLHDSAKQEALAASFHLGTALTLFEKDPQFARSHLAEADALVDSVRIELTDLIHELRPPSMNDGRFEDTVNEYIIEWAHQTGIAATFNVTDSRELPLETKQTIYRIMQEALSNAARHSAAQNVLISLANQEKEVVFFIQDDGTGFDPQQQSGGIGLASMRERAESLNGTLDIASEAGQGTIVCVTFPINN